MCQRRPKCFVNRKRGNCAKTATINKQFEQLFANARKREIIWY